MGSKCSREAPEQQQRRPSAMGGAGAVAAQPQGDGNARLVERRRVRGCCAFVAALAAAFVFRLDCWPITYFPRARRARGARLLVGG